MATKTTVDSLAADITQTIKDYTDSVVSAIEKEVEATAKAIQADIKAHSPVDTGEYRKGWSRSKSQRGGALTYRIYNRTKPSLTHLLEDGHAIRGGGRVEGKPHIAPAEERHIPVMERNIKKIIEDGG